LKQRLAAKLNTMLKSLVVNSAHIRSSSHGLAGWQPRRAASPFLLFEPKFFA
jgi:hypothetical protein